MICFQASFLSTFPSDIGTCYVKRCDGLTYIIVTSKTFPCHIAVECLDAMFEPFRSAGTRWGHRSRSKAKAKCCQAMLLKFMTTPVEEEGIESDDSVTYSGQVKELQEECARLHDQMNRNIQGAYQNVADVERLQKKSDDCLELCKEFRKQAKKWNKDRIVIVVGTALAATGGAAVGLVLAGHSGACACAHSGAYAGAHICTLICAHGGAKAIEFGVVGGLLAGGGFFAKYGPINTWSWSQPFKLI
jgi:uncharacterized protein YcfJ